MDVYSRKIAGVKHDDITVFTRQEADDRGIQYKHWRTADTGEWAITDDGYVGYCYARYDFPQRKSEVARGTRRSVHYFGFGNLMNTRKDPYLYERRRATGRWQSDKSWSEALASQRVSKMCAKIYVLSLLNTGKVDWETLGKILGPKDEKPEWKARRIFKTQEFKKMVEDELEKALTAKGITKEKVLDYYTKAMEIAEMNSDPETMLKGAKALGDLVGLAPKVQKTTKTLELEHNLAQLTDGVLQNEQSIARISQTTQGTKNEDRQIQSGN